MKVNRLPEWNVGQLHGRIRANKKHYLNRPRYLKQAVLYATGKAGEWRRAGRRLTPGEEAILAVYVNMLKIRDDAAAARYLFRGD